LQSHDDITRLLEDLHAGREEAKEELIPLLYRELRTLAGQLMRSQRPGHTLQATALVNEAYLRLMGGKEGEWKDRRHFLKVAARAMRSVLIDHARNRLTVKRGKGLPVITLEEGAVFSDRPSNDILALDEALTRLGALDQRMAQVVELRFFGGFTVEETGRILGTSPATVKREWLTAKAWLREEILRGGGDGY
jgi:RNA polymerase sigma factor (TIGR02999 family)